MTTPARLAAVSYLARDYDEAIAWFQRALGFVLIEDSDLGNGRRWVRMAPRPDADTQFVIARAEGGEIASVGQAAGGRVAYFLHVDDIVLARARMEAVGVVFDQPTRRETWGLVTGFRDLYGNRWDLIHPSRQRHQDPFAPVDDDRHDPYAPDDPAAPHAPFGPDRRDPQLR